MKKLPLESEPCHCLIEKSMIMSSKVTMNVMDLKIKINGVDLL